MTFDEKCKEAAETWREKYSRPGEFEETGQQEAWYAGAAFAKKEFETERNGWIDSNNQMNHATTRLRERLAEKDSEITQLASVGSQQSLLLSTQADAIDALHIKFAEKKVYFTRLQQERDRWALSHEKLELEKTHLAGLVGVAREALDNIRPNCEACGNPAVILFDTCGEGYFWLCERRDGDHDDDHYSGYIRYDLRESLSKLDPTGGRE